MPGPRGEVHGSWDHGGGNRGARDQVPRVQGALCLGGKGPKVQRSKVQRAEVQGSRSGVVWGGLCGSLRASVGLCGSLWDSLGLCGPLWVSVGLCGSLWGCVGLCGSLWVFVGLCGSLWVSLGQCGPGSRSPECRGQGCKAPGANCAGVQVLGSKVQRAEVQGSSSGVVCVGLCGSLWLLLLEDVFAFQAAPVSMGTPDTDCLSSTA